MADLIAKEYKKFEDIKHVDESGLEFWFARELAVCLEYAKWDNFKKVIERAMLACQNSGFGIPDHFLETTKPVEMPTRPKKDQDNLGFTDVGKT